LERQFVRREDAAREDAKRRSRAAFGGQALEELAPHFPDFPFNPKDLRFIGDPIDYVVFDGLTEGSLREIVLLEVKSGRSKLSGSQRSIRDALEDRAVSWSLYRAPAELTESP
jgi:predicted Holliday junction resolvase-like endonuclease